MALVTFAVLPFVFVAAFLFRARIREVYRNIRVRLARINAYLHERITRGCAWCSSSTGEAADTRTHEEINEHYLQAHLKSITYYALFFPVIEVFTAIAVALIIWYGGGEIIQGTVTVGVVAAFPPIRAPLLPPHSGPLREVQSPPGRDGVLGAGVPAPRSRRGDPRS